MQPKVIPINTQNQQELFTAEVKSCQSNMVILSSSRGVSSAQVAASCLLKPDVGDTVLVCDTPQSSYILSILEKSSSKQILNLQQDTDIQCQGHLNIHSDQSLKMSSAVESSTHAPIIAQNSGKQKITSQHLDITAAKAQLVAKNIDVSATQCHSVIERIYQKADQVFRTVTTLENLKAGNLIQSVKNIWNSQSRNTVITAESDVKVDAQRIHMG
jgi:hypothetical protein